MTHLYTKYNHLTTEELISIAENSDDEMILELVSRMNTPEHNPCGVEYECDHCGHCGIA